MDLTKYLAKPDKSIAEHNRDLLDALERLRELKYINEELYRLTRKACIYHDYGKVNKEFQKRVGAKDRKQKFCDEREVIHNVLSFFFINPEEFEAEEDYYRIAHAVINHHNYSDVYQTLEEKSDLIQLLLADFGIYPMKRRTKKRLAEIVEDDKAVKIKGYLHKCDYSASAGNQVEYPNDFLIDALEYLRLSWKSKNPQAGWNELQSFCIENQRENIIAVAQTGMGKTEAGLHWIGNHKGYFVLPLRTAINAIYDRVRVNLLQNEKIDTRVAILHSESLEYYTKNIPEEEIDFFNYYNRGKQMAMPLNISTMDQLFDFIFKYQGYELKLTTLSYSKVVIDEIQMYSPDLLAYLIAGLEAIHKLGGKIAIVTATLSPFIKDRLSNIPFVKKTFVNDVIRHHVKVVDCLMDGVDIWTTYMNNLQNGKSNKILVVCNTIRKAQEIYRELKSIGEENDVSLPLSILHSRFIRMEREEKEKEILLFGKTHSLTGEIDCQTGIWISTSLVEASLDIDFDYLFTELQDINSLFQRLGRCNRKGVKDISKVNCYVYNQIEQSNMTSNGGFIDDTIFHLSQMALQSLDGPITEINKLQLIDQYLTTDNLLDSAYYREYCENYQFIKDIAVYKFEKEDNKLRNILSENIIPSPVYERYQEVIGDLQDALRSDNAANIKKIKLKEKIMMYTVNIPSYRLLSYEKEVRKGRAQEYPEISLGKYHNIKVMECLYDNMGFRPVRYHDVVRPANIL